MMDSNEYGVIVYKRDPIYLKNLIKNYIKAGYDIDCYVRHESTLNAINDFFELSLAPSSSLYKHRKGDVIIVVTLKSPQRGKEVEVASIDDLDLYVVSIITFSPSYESEVMKNE
jgi:hypothetical protein